MSDRSYPTELGLLDDPDYVPQHPPINGRISEVVALWGPRSQYRWFRRFQDEVGAQPHTVWDRFYCDSLLHRGLHCGSCIDDQYAGYGDCFDDWCCCRVPSGLSRESNPASIERTTP